MTTLSDKDIKLLMRKGNLVPNGDPSRALGACYELRMGNVYYDLTEGDKPIQVPAGGTVLIKPGHRVVLITHEELKIPADVLGRVVSKGSLFSIGLNPVATYADPGFMGSLGIVTQNISDKFIELLPLEPIAKIDFTKLTSSADSAYNGQHGFKTQIWPIKDQLQKSYSELRGDPRVGTEKEEAYKLLPQATAQVLQRLEFRQKLTDAAILLAVILNATALFLVGNNLIDNFQGLIGNLVASVIVGVVVVIAKWKK